MSVIIRLQNLPWNANALDIRRFFQGLSIPDGGVHIIGGEKGDVFIAFSTDEDARQAMMNDGGRINGFAIKLLLSSKTEMQNVIAAAKGAPPALPPAPAVGLGIPQQKPPIGGFYDRPVIPAVGGAPVQFVSGNVGGDVTGSGQGLRSSTGLGNLPPPGPYGSYPGSAGQVAVPPAGGGSLVRINEPMVIQAAPVIQPAARSMFDARPSDRPPMPGNLQQPPPVAPMEPAVPGRASLPALPPVGGWTSSPMTRDVPPPQNFSRPPDIPGNQGPGFGNTFNPGVGREPLRMDGRPLEARPVDTNYSRNGHVSSAPADGGRNFPDTGRNFISSIEPGRNLGPPPVDVGRDMGRDDSRMPLGRPEERREPPRYMGDQPGWAEREPSGPGRGWSGSGRPFDGRDAGRESRREFMRPEVDRGFRAPDRWMESRDRADMGPGPGPGDRQDRSMMFRDSPGAYGRERMPEDRPQGDSRMEFGRPEPGFREPPPRAVMEEPLRRPLPPPEQRWLDDRRDFGPPGPRFDGRPPSPPRDRRFPGFPPRDDPWHDDRSMDMHPRDGDRDGAAMRGLCIRAENFPNTFNYRHVRRFFHNVEIPRDGIKLINDRSGMRTGLVFIRVADNHSVHVALDRNAQMVDGCMICVRRCPDEEFDMAVDGKPLKTFHRSRSPRRRPEDEPSNVSYFVLKKLPLKTEKDDIRKFFAKFQIASEGGPFFELAFDKTPTGNALIALEEKDASKALVMHRTLLNGARVDLIKITHHEFAERSRRARQCDRDAEKDSGPGKSPAASSFKKSDKPEPKSKEPDRTAASAAEEDVSGDAEQRVYCVELRGIPYTASPAMVQDFFRDIDVPLESIHIVYNREHRATGSAFVEFASIADQKRALEKDKQHMSHRYVELRAVSQTAMVQEFNKQQQKFGGTLLNLPGKPERPKAGSRAMLSMQNLHYNTQLEDILDFFAGYHPIVDSIKLQYKDSQPTGDGLIEFESMPEAESAFRTKNRHMLLGKPITLGWPKN